MTREELATLSTEDLMEALEAHPELRAQVAKNDPRVRLMEELYLDPVAKRDIQRHGKRLHPNAVVPEIDIPDEMRKEIKPLVDKITALEGELGQIKTGGARQRFRERLVGFGAETDDLDAIETFMVDNEYGPKAAESAVAAFYRTKEAAEPNVTPDNFKGMFPEGGGAKHLEALFNAGPDDDLDEINRPYVEQIVKEEFGRQSGPSRSSRPAMA